MNHKNCFCALLLMAIPALAADPKKPPAKTPPAKPPTKGTTQMAGAEAVIGTAYTLGKIGAINFTLDSAEFRVERVNIGEETDAPKADEKLLVLNYTVHNPNKELLQYDWGTLKFTAVDVQNVNHESVGRVARIGTGESVSLELKPGQKLGVFTAVVVPAKGVVPKLIVQHPEGGPVLRYDLRKVVKALVAPFADSADAAGATAKNEVVAEVGKFYPLLKWDIKLASAAYVAGPLGEHEVAEDQRFFVATVALKNASSLTISYDTATFAPILIASDDEKSEHGGRMLKTARNEYAGGELKPGQEYTARFAFAIPKNVTAKTLQLLEPESRVYSFDVSATK